MWNFLFGFQNALEKELGELRNLIQNERKENESTINELERKAVQDKDRIKKDMTNKIKETKLNMMKLTNDHLKATTKRTIMENQQYFSELAYQSRQTEKLLLKNEKLLSENADYRRKLELNVQTEAELAKKNSTYQKTIKSLCAKLQQQGLHNEEADKYTTKLNSSIKELESDQNIAMLQVADLEAKLEAAQIEIESKVTDFERYKAVRSELEHLLVSSLEECKRGPAENNKGQAGNYPENFADYSAQQKESVLSSLLKKIDLDCFVGAKRQDGTSSARSATDLTMPSLCGRPPSSIQIVDGAISSGSSTANDVLQLEPTTTKTNTGIQTSAIFTPEVEFYRETIRGRGERQWGEVSKTLPLTHRDARTFLRKGNVM